MRFSLYISLQSVYLFRIVNMENSNKNEFNFEFIHGYGELGYDKTKRREKR